MFMLKSHLMPHLYWHGLVKVGQQTQPEIINQIYYQLAGLVGGTRSLQETIQLWPEISRSFITSSLLNSL